MNEKLLFKKGKYIVGITEEGKLFEGFGMGYSRNILGGAAFYIEELQKQLQQSQQKLGIATEVLLEVSSNEYDNYDIYDDEFEKQVNYLTSRANKALTKIKEVK